MYRVLANTRTFLDRDCSAPVALATAALVCIAIYVLCVTIGGLHIEVRP